MTLKITQTPKKILDRTYNIVRQSDGVQRTEFQYHAEQPLDSDAHGAIWTDKWTNLVTARAADGTTKALGALRGCLTKDQAFRQLHRWIAAKDQGLGA